MTSITYCNNGYTININNYILLSINDLYKREGDDSCDKMLTAL